MNCGDFVNKVNRKNNNLYNIIYDLDFIENPITITTKEKESILIPKEEWRSIEETLYLLDIPGYKDKVCEIRQTKDWEKEGEYTNDEEW